MRIKGPDRAEMEATADEFEAMVDAGMREATKIASKDIKATSTPDDLGAIRRVWERHMTEVLVPFLEQVFVQAAETQRAVVQDKVLVAAAPIPPVQKTLAEDYLATASNRLRGVSDEVWEHARSEMLDGLHNGESIPQIRKRIQAATGFAKPRATTIARTEVIGATNRGSLAQMKAAGYPGTKTWLATNDHRTRPTHRDANNNTADLESTGGTDKFIVGGFAMDGPHDPAAPPGETINCRCTLTYDIPDEFVPEPGLSWDSLDKDAGMARMPGGVFFGSPEERAFFEEIQAEIYKDVTFFARGSHTLAVDRIEDLDRGKLQVLLNTADDLLRDFPPQGNSRSLVLRVVDLEKLNAYGATLIGRADVSIHRNMLTKSKPLEYGSDTPNFMPAAAEADNIRYTLAHEWGHVLEPEQTPRLVATAKANRYFLSRYGTTSEHEAYAEAFAEWYLTRGATKNEAARDYAKEFGWRLS